jgi:hypothetical protein
MPDQPRKARAALGPVRNAGGTSGARAGQLWSGAPDADIGGVPWAERSCRVPFLEQARLGSSPAEHGARLASGCPLAQ